VNRVVGHSVGRLEDQPLPADRGVFIGDTDPRHPASAPGEWRER